MKHLKLFEQKSYEEHVAEICQKYRIENWYINSEGLVDVDGNVFLSKEGLTKLPLSFGRVSGDFLCNSNELTSLRFAPDEVGGKAVVLPNPISDIPEKYLTREYLQFIVKEQTDWRLYNKDGYMRLDRLEEMIEWGIVTKKTTTYFLRSKS